MDKLVELYNEKFNAKLNKSTLSRYENGLQEPMFTVVVNLAELFSVSVDYIIGKSEALTAPKINITLSADEETLITNYRKLNKDNKNKAQEYISDLKTVEKYTASENASEIKLAARSISADAVIKRKMKLS